MTVCKLVCFKYRKTPSQGASRYNKKLSDTDVCYMMNYDKYQFINKFITKT